MRKSVKVLLSAALMLGGIVAVAAIANNANAAACNTVSTHLVNRPDSGNHGDWAIDSITRKVVICEGSTAGEGASHYHATVTDSGTFVTIAGHSPQAGAAIAAGTHGTISGGFTADFTAASGFKNYQGNLNGITYTGSAPVSTSVWVQKVWGGEDAKGSFINDDWSWKYTTCSETWTDAANNQDGSLAADGDITGKKCPSQSPTPSPVKSSASPSPSASTSASASTSPTPVPTASAPNPVTVTLPVTG